MSDAQSASLSPYRNFSKAEWAKLRADTPMPLDAEQLQALSGVNESLSLAEAIEVYLPISRLLSLYVEASQSLHEATSRFLGRAEKTPFVIGMGGSVAVGKSTAARVLQQLLSRWPNHPNVALVPTDGFLLPNRILEEKGLMTRKGFPQSYDSKRLLRFMADVKAGERRVTAPRYSHFKYDVLEDDPIVVDRPDVLIVEGLNVLQPATLPDDGEAVPFVSDYFDFSIYVHADAAIIAEWYRDRFMTLRATAFQDPGAYFHRYAEISETEALAVADRLWNTINLVNLQQNILPTRRRADLILSKARDHSVSSVFIRKL